MKLNTETTTVETIGEVKSQEFKIRASATSFAILSSGLYSNKILAVVRELSCNAFDAHKEAGTTDTPFEITLPSTLYPCFVIKDFGTGLSHDKVMSLYTTYFESTKNESDDYIGQLGLGSKSPFSYTGQFTVESRQAGTSNVYSMYINEDGIPAISHMGNNPTDEPNGMTITVAVKHHDFYNFREACESALMYFNPHPNVIGSYTKRSIEYRLKKDTWAIRDESYSYSSKSYVVQGFVRYPIDINQIRAHSSDDIVLSDEGASILEAPIDFIVPIGLVQVAPSREHLSYDKRTIQNLIKFINGVADDISNSLSGMISSSKSLWDARITANSFMKYDSPFRRLYEKLISKNFKLEYNGILLNRGIDVSKIDLTDIDIVEHRKKPRGYRKQVESAYHTKALVASSVSRGLFDHIYLSVDADTIVVFNDVNMSHAKIRAYVNGLASNTTVYEVRASDKKVDISNKVSTIYDDFGIAHTEVLSVSELIKTNKITSPAKMPRALVDRTQRPIWSSNSFINHNYNKYDWYRDNINFSSGGYYVKYYEGKWVDNHVSLKINYHLGGVIKLLKDHGYIKKSQKIVGANSKDIKKFSEAYNWFDIQDIFELFVLANYKKFSDNIVCRKMQSAIVEHDFININVESMLKNISETSPARLYFEKFLSIKKLSASNDVYDSRFINQISFNNMTIKEKVFDDVDIQSDFDFDSIYKQYPMLNVARHISRYSIEPKHIKMICDYIDLADSEKSKTAKMMKKAINLDIVTATA